MAPPMTAEEIAAALSYGHELRGVEVKGPGPRTDAHLLAKVARAALSMANLRDGGQVVIGIDDADPAAMLPGLVPEDLETWLAYDDVSRKLAEYADPPLAFRVAARELPSGATVAVLGIEEFEDQPVLCAKDFPNVLRRGACYVRSRRVPETAEIPTAAEMRDLLSLAVEKGIRAYVEIAERARIQLVTQPEPDLEDAAAAFEAEQKDAW